MSFSSGPTGGFSRSTGSTSTAVKEDRLSETALKTTGQDLIPSVYVTLA